MTANYGSNGGHHPRLHRIAKRLRARHARNRERRREAEVERALNEADFELRADLGLPSPARGHVGYDILADLAIDKEPREVRD